MSQIMTPSEHIEEAERLMALSRRNYDPGVTAASSMHSLLAIAKIFNAGGKTAEEMLVERGFGHRDILS